MADLYFPRTFQPNRFECWQDISSCRIHPDWNPKYRREPKILIRTSISNGGNQRDNEVGSWRLYQFIRRILGNNQTNDAIGSSDERNCSSRAWHPSYSLLEWECNSIHVEKTGLAHLSLWELRFWRPGASRKVNISLHQPMLDSSLWSL